MPLPERALPKKYGEITSHRQYTALNIGKIQGPLTWNSAYTVKNGKVPTLSTAGQNRARTNQLKQILAKRDRLHSIYDPSHSGRANRIGHDTTNASPLSLQFHSTQA